MGGAASAGGQGRAGESRGARCGRPEGRPGCRGPGLGDEEDPTAYRAGMDSRGWEGVRGRPVRRFQRTRGVCWGGHMQGSPGRDLGTCAPNADVCLSE